MRQDQGFILVVTLMITAAVAILVFGTAFTSTIDRAISANQRDANTAYQVALSGLDKYKTIAFQTFSYYLSHLDDYKDELSSGNPVCGNLLSIGLDLDRDGSVATATGSPDMPVGGTTGWQPLGAGKYNVKFDVTNQYMILESRGRAGRSEASVRLIVVPQNDGIFSNAIFTGAGQSGKFLNGNAQVYGSVHIEGDAARLSDSTTSNDYVIDGNGSFAMHNNYKSSDVKTALGGTNLEDAALTSFLKDTATNQKDMCARLRVEHGKVKVSGSVDLGDATADAGYEPSLAGVHIYDGPVNLEQGSGAAAVYADQVTAYDMEPSPKFPYLDDPLTDGHGGGEACKADPTASSWRDCLHASAGMTLDAAAPNPNCDVSLLAPSTSPTTVVFDATSIDCSIDTDYDGLADTGFKYTADPVGNKGELTVYGLVNLKGYNMEFARNIKTRYEKQATFFLEKDGAGQGGYVKIAGDLLPSTSFPDQDVLGIVAEDQLYMTGETQNTSTDFKEQVATGMFYSAKEVRVDKGGVVFGNMTAPGFQLAAGGKTTIFQVPGLEYNLPPGLDQLQYAMTPTFRIESFERR